MSGSAVEWREPSFKELWDGLKAGKFDWIHGTAILDLGIYPENGELLLIQLCASTESQALVKLLEGEKVIAQHRDLVPFIENTPLLLRVLGMCEPAQRDALLHFVRSLVLNSVADKTAFEDAFIRGNACAIRYFYTNLVPMVIPEKEKRYAIFVNAANMLFKREAYDEARVLYEHALENAEDEASCRWGILLCALYIQDVKEIAENDFFDPEMPEYRLLMRSIGNKEQKKQFEQLAQQNAEYQRQMQESHAEAVPERPSFLKQLVAWISKWWGASLAVLFLAFVFFFNGGAFWTTIWNRIPFVNGIGEGGIFYEIFSVFVLLAFVLNIGPALGMTTNITTLVRAVASSIYQDDDFEDEVPYSKCLRITMFFINAGSCLAVGSFGELFAGQTTFSLASGVIFGIIMGVAALVFLFLVHHGILLLFLEYHYGTEWDGPEFGCRLLLWGVIMQIGCVHMIIQKQGSALSEFTGFESFGLICFSVIAIALMVVGIVMTLIVYQCLDEAEFGLTGTVLLAAAVLIIVYCCLFVHTIGWYWGIIAILAIAGLFFLVPALLTKEGRETSGYLLVSLPVFAICFIACLQHVIAHFDFSVVTETVRLFLPDASWIENGYGRGLVKTFRFLFLGFSMLCILIPPFASMVSRFLDEVLDRIFDAIPIFDKEFTLEVDTEEVGSTLAKKGMLFVCHGVLYTGLSNLLQAMFESFDGSFLEGVIITLIALVFLVVALFLSIVIIRLFAFWDDSDFGFNLFHWEFDVDSMLWSLGYHLSNIAILIFGLGSLSVFGVGTETAKPLIGVFVMVGAFILLVLCHCLRLYARGESVDGDEIDEAERVPSFVYMGLLLLLILYGNNSGASSVYLFPIVLAIINKVFMRISNEW